MITNLPPRIIVRVNGAPGVPGKDGTGGGGGAGLPVLTGTANPNATPRVTATGLGQQYRQGTGTPYVWWLWDGTVWVVQGSAQLPPYVSPYFTGFGIDGYTNNAFVEIGAPFTAAKMFRWTVSDPNTVKSEGIITYMDSNPTLDLASGLPPNGNTSVTPNSSWNSPLESTGRSFQIKHKNTQDALFTAAFKINATFPWAYGYVNGPTRPTAITQAQFDAARGAGSGGVQDSNGTIFANFQSLNSQYIWFAIPFASANKTIWYQNAINAGPIGDIVGNPKPDPGGNLFPSPVSASFNTTFRTGAAYKVYISNYMTALPGCELRNS